MKKLLIIGDNPNGFNLQTDTTYLFLVSAKLLGCEIYYSFASDLVALNEEPLVITHPISLNVDITTNDIPQNWYQLGNSKMLPLKNFDLILVRNDPPFNLEYYYLTQILSLAEANDVPVINPSFALRNFNEKLSILQLPKLITPTLVSKNKVAIYTFLEQHTDCVIKPIDLMAGRGVFKLSLTDSNCDAIIEAATDYFTQTVMLQKFIPGVVKGDKRIFIVHGQVIDYCLCRIPKKNAIRSNIASGGHGIVQKLTEKDHSLAKKVATWTKKHHIAFCGIDVIGGYLTEINITSPTGTRQIFEQTGINIPSLVLAPFFKK